MRTIIGAAAMLIFSGAAVAAPFCIVTASGKQCYYYDSPSCERAAASARGASLINDAEVHAPPAGQGAPFCVVTATGTNCWYYDAPSCQRAAASARGQCVVNR